MRPIGMLRATRALLRDIGQGPAGGLPPWSLANMHGL